MTLKMTAVKNVLFLCVGNSARGLLAEALLTIKSKGAFKGYSAGAHPGGLVNPFAAELIQQIGYPLETVRCKRWEEFSGENAIPMDYVITLCDQVAAMEQPLWKGNPISASWEIEDPTATTGSIEEKRIVFKRAFDQIAEHIELFLMLPCTNFDRTILHQELNSFSLMCKYANPSLYKSLYRACLNDDSQLA